MQIRRPRDVADRSAVDSVSTAGVPVANKELVRRSREPFKRADTVVLATIISIGRALTIFTVLLVVGSTSLATIISIGRALTIFTMLLVVGST